MEDFFYAVRPRRLRPSLSSGHFLPSGRFSSLRLSSRFCLCLLLGPFFNGRGALSSSGRLKTVRPGCAAGGAAGAAEPGARPAARRLHHHHRPHPRREHRLRRSPPPFPPSARRRLSLVSGGRRPRHRGAGVQRRRDLAKGQAAQGRRRAPPRPSAPPRALSCGRRTSQTIRGQRLPSRPAQLLRGAGDGRAARQPLPPRLGHQERGRLARAAAAHRAPRAFPCPPPATPPAQAHAGSGCPAIQGQGQG
eukprot:SAG11_NODE_1504_length_4782_cov_3.311125_3_plen_249_part_00